MVVPAHSFMPATAVARKGMWVSPSGFDDVNWTDICLRQ